MPIKIESQNTPPNHANAVPPSAETVPDNTCNGKCSGCGECCLSMTLRITNAEITKIRKYIKTNNIKPQRHFPTNVPLAIMNPATQPLFVDTICPFLDTSAEQGHNCTIYPVRPIICRTYICKMYHDQTVAKQVYDETVAACHGEHAAYALLSSPERNLQQLFFPEEYTPKPYDIVVVNDTDFDIYEQYKGIAFVVTELDRKVKNGTRELCLIRTDIPAANTVWCPVDSLTIIKKAERI